QNVSTVKTAFGGGIERVDLDKGSSIPGRFVFQLADTLAPSDITDGLGQAMVLDLQTLHANRLVLTDHAGREVLLIIATAIGYSRVDPSHLAAGLLTVARAFFLLAKATVCTCQFLLVTRKEFGVAKGVPIGGDHHRLKSQVQPNLFV